MRVSHMVLFGSLGRKFGFTAWNLAGDEVTFIVHVVLMTPQPCFGDKHLSAQFAIFALRITPGKPDIYTRLYPITRIAPDFYPNSFRLLTLGRLHPCGKIASGALEQRCS